MEFAQQSQPATAYPSYGAHRIKGQHLYHQGRCVCKISRHDMTGGGPKQVGTKCGWSQAPRTDLSCTSSGYGDCHLFRSCAECRQVNTPLTSVTHPHSAPLSAANPASARIQSPPSQGLLDPLSHWVPCRRHISDQAGQCHGCAVCLPYQAGRCAADKYAVIYNCMNEFNRPAWCWRFPSAMEASLHSGCRRILLAWGALCCCLHCSWSLFLAA
jgi:hypothetical protein